MPQIVRLAVGEHIRQPGPTSNAFDQKILELWVKVNVFDLSMMNALSSIIDHAPSAAIAAEFQSLEIIYEKVVKGLNARERPMRVAAG